MSKKLNKRIIACVTAVFTIAVMCGAPAVAFATDGSSVKKEETVYVVTEPNGAQDNVIVSDHLVNEDGLKTITDQSNLKSIENVKGDEKFTRDGNNIKWEAAGNDIYYQGTTVNKIPVTMDVSYYLDGRKVDSKKLKNASGDVRIVIRYSNSTKVPFLAMTGFIADNNTFKNVKVSSGKVINDGDKQIVACLAAPGLCQQMGMSQDELGFGDNVVITGQANKFDVEDMMTIVTGDVSDLDLENLDIDQLDSSIKKLDSSAVKLKNGSKELKDGSKQVKDGTSTLKDKLQTATAGAKSIYEGLLGVKGSLNEPNRGIKKVASTIDAGIGSINSDATAASTSNQEALTKLNSIKNDSTLSEDEKNAINDAINAITESKSKDVAIIQKTTSTETGATLRDASSGLVGGLNKLDQEGISPLITGSTSLYDGLTAGQAGAEKLADGADELNAGADDLSDGMNKFYQEGIKKLVDMYNDQLKGTIDGLDGAMDAGKAYKSFTKLSEGMDGNVKFIYKTTIFE